MGQTFLLQIGGFFGNLLDEFFDLWLVFFERWSEHGGIQSLGTLSLRHHQIQEENYSEDGVVWDEVEDEAKEKLGSLEKSEDGPEAEPRVGLYVVIRFDRLY